MKSDRCLMALATHCVILLLKFIRYSSSSVAAPALPADFLFGLFVMKNSELCLHTLLDLTEAPADSGCLITHIGGLAC